MDFYTIIGVIGALIILAAFFLNETHRVSEDSLDYDLMNLVGAFLLLIYAFSLRSWPFLILNSIWLLVALRDVTLSFKKK